jgi:dihydrofolate reductase
MVLSVNIFSSLDGVVQGPGGPDEDTRGGFDRGGWFIPFTSDAVFGEIVAEWFRAADALLLGCTTFEMFRGYWPQVTDPDDPVATTINAGPRYVVSSTLTDPAWEGTIVVDPTDLAGRIAALKQSVPGELQVHGSARLARSLHDLGLVDVYRIFLAPVALGGGLRLFDDGAVPSGFDVTRSHVAGSGLVYLELTPKPLEIAEAAVEDGRDTTR